jgi:outer membrane receptor protein involved in Fe transport
VGLEKPLGTETSWHYETGLYQKIGKNTDVKASVYYIDIDNYLVYNTASSYYSSSYAYSIPSMQFYGFEGEFNTAVFDGLNLFGNYSYQGNKYDDREDVYDPKKGEPTPHFLNLPAKHKANLGIRYDLPMALRISGDVKYVGKRKSEGGETMGDYITMDVGLARTFYKFCKVSAFVSNLLGEKYQEVYGFPEPRQTYGMQMELTY